jgi:peptide/nickel transport system substrate-binding protein
VTRRCRSFPPKAIDDLKRALGDKIVVQEADWNTIMGAAPNQRKERFQDVRVRQALGYALDRHGTVEHIAQIAIVKSVGGIFFPGHPLAAPNEHLEKLPGFGKDIEAAREKARALLKEAGYENLKVTLWNRAVDQPYTAIGTWYVDQWRRVGIEADQTIVPSGPWYANRFRTKEFDVTMDPSAQTIVNPTIDTAKFQCGAGDNFTSCEDEKTVQLYEALLFETDAEKQHKHARAYEDYVLGETAQWIPAFWWYRQVAHRDYMKGWKVSPSHYLVQQLDNVWIDPKLR